MKVRFRFESSAAYAFAGGLALFCCFGTPTAALAQSASLSQKAPDAGKAAAMMNVAKQKGHVRVIVMFNSPVSPAAVAKDAAGVENLKARVAAAREAILASHFGNISRQAAGPGFARGLTSFPITSGFAVNVSAQELDALAADPRVLSIQEDRLDKPSLNDSLPLIGMPVAYVEGALGTGQTVAVLDTGVKSNHEFLAGKVVAEACFSNAGGGASSFGGVSLCPGGGTTQIGAGAANPNAAQCNAASGNICEHGTHVAGIAAGLNTAVSAGDPLTGVAKASKIFAIQIFTRFNDDSLCGVGNSPCALSFNSDQMLALDHVFANRTPGGFPVASINMSLGGGQFTSACDTDARKASIDALRSVGVITAIAAGNDSFTSAVGAPGCISTAFTVGSTTKSDVISSFSNMASVVDVMAPGSSINSSIVLNSGSTTSYAFFNGTSMATPHVAGAIAALKSRYPGATAGQIEQALKTTGKTIADTRLGGTVSKPRIRMERATQQGWWGYGNAGTGDFNNDGKSDILWRRTSDGAVVAWLMNGGVRIGTANLGAMTADWAIAALGDLNADGTTDVIWRKTDGSGVIWLMNGASPGAKLAVASFTSSNLWSAQGVGKFFGSSSFGDILWRATDGQLYIWRMNGVTPISTTLVGSPALGWNVGGIGDFDGDGISDILLRNDTGANQIWRISNGAVANVQNVTAVGTVWTLAGVRDVNGDGKSDLLWRHNNGTVVTWRMNGPAIAGTATVGSAPAVWNVMDTGSFSGAGAGLLWRQNNGAAAIWFINNVGGLGGTAGLGVVP